jgi:site-specific DNA-methyltransferase (adenine-specific)
MDCLEGMKLLDDNSIDNIVTDPPYELGFMGKKWDNTGIAYNVDVWKECLRVLKPGGHLLAFGGTRTYHRMTCAIEDAGFEIRDCIQWLYGSGFPKSHNISKAIDKRLGGTPKQGRFLYKNGKTAGGKRIGQLAGGAKHYETIPDTEQARQWDGWGTALKPANEPIVLARKPLSEKTVAENVLKWGTGGINIDGCRIEYQSEKDFESAKGGDSGSTKCNIFSANVKKQSEKITLLGRFPANVILDEEAGKLLDEQSGITTNTRHMSYKRSGGEFINGVPSQPEKGWFKEETGGASRFFYCAKASKKERGEGNNHPTVKPVSLIKYLVTLVTPPDGVCLDPFMGSGTTAVACIKTNRKYIGFELLEEYCKIAEKRISETTSNQIDLPEIERNVPQRQFDWLDELLEGE